MLGMPVKGGFLLSDSMTIDSVWLQALTYSLKTRRSDGSQYYLITGQRFSKDSFGGIQAIRDKATVDEKFFERIVHYLNAMDKKYQPLIPVKDKGNEFWRVDFDRADSEPPKDMLGLVAEYDSGPKTFVKPSAENQLSFHAFNSCSKDLKRQFFKISSSYASKAEQIAKKQNKTKSKVYEHAAMRYIDALGIDETLF